MSDHQIIMWFFGACAVFWLLQKIGTATERAAEEAKRPRKELPETLICTSTAEADARKEEISRLVSQFLSKKPDRLKLDLSFEDDLRVPPGELHVMLDQIEEHYRITIHHKNIRTFGDLLAVVEVHQTEN